MNRKNELAKLKRQIAEDRYELEVLIGRAVKCDMVAVLKEYFDIDESDCDLSLVINKNGEIRLNFCSKIKNVVSNI